MCSLPCVSSLPVSNPLLSYPAALASPPSLTGYRYFDNACSQHITNELSYVYDLRPLLSPFTVNGIGSGVTISHSCRFRCLPAARDLNKGVFSAQATGTLLSLGHIQRCGGSYRPSLSSLGIDVVLPGGLVFASSRLDSNNMLPISSLTLSRPFQHTAALVAFAAIVQNPHTFPGVVRSLHEAVSPDPSVVSRSPSGATCSPTPLPALVAPSPSPRVVPAPPAPPPAPALSPPAPSPRAQPPAVASVSIPASAIVPPAPSLLSPPVAPRVPYLQDVLAPLPAPGSHVTAEARARCEEVEVLLHDLGFPTDGRLCRDLAVGAVISHLVPADVALNRALRGPCPHTVAGTYRAPSSPPSHTPAETSVGQALSVDLVALPAKSVGGHLWELVVVDHFSGCFHTVPCGPSKSRESILAHLVSFLRLHYAAHGHAVSEIRCDNEPVLLSLAPALGALGIKLRSTPAGEHCHTIERYVGTLRGRIPRVLSPLPYHLPAMLTPHLHAHVASLISGSVTDRSFPLTPDFLRTGCRAPPPAQFGACFMVPCGIAKRTHTGLDAGRDPRDMPRTEVGVCLGACSVTGQYRFYTANGQVVSRRLGTRLSPDFIPFGWPPKPYVPRAHLSPRSSHTVPLAPTVALPDAVPAATPAGAPPNPVPAPATPPSAPPAPVPAPAPAAPAAPSAPAALPTPRPVVTPGVPSVVALGPAPPASRPLAVSAVGASPQSPPTPSSRPPRSRRAPARLATALVASRSFMSPNRFASLSCDDDDDCSSDVPVSDSDSDDDSDADCAFPFAAPRALVAPGAVMTKLANSRRTTARNRAYVDSLAPSGLSNRPSPSSPDFSAVDLSGPDPAVPLSNAPALFSPTYPASPSRTEVNTRESVRQWGIERATAAEAKELTKIFTTYRSLRLIEPGELERGAIFLRSMSLHKLKLSNGVVSCRFVLDGGSQPSSSYGDTFSSTSDQSNRFFVLSAALADAAARSVLDDLVIADCDVPGAFLHNDLPRSATGGRQLVTHLPKHLLDQRYAGRLCVVDGCQYGLKQSNSIWDADVAVTMVSGGFAPLESDPHIYVRHSLSNPMNRIVVSVHVDDFFIVSNQDDDDLYGAFKRLIHDRYGADVPFNDSSSGMCSVEFQRHANHSVSLSVGKFIRKTLAKYGFDDVAPALTPSLPDLFSIDPTSPPLSPALANVFRRINGSLIWPSAVRFDIAKEVSFLSRRNIAPTAQDLDKQTHVLRYLKGCPDLGPVFSSRPQLPGASLSDLLVDGSSAVHLVAESDASHAVHDEGQDQLAFTIRVGDRNAPFFVWAGVSPYVVSPNPMVAEYVTMNKAAQKLVHFRQLASDLGYDQSAPSTLGGDSQSGINLAVAPEVTRKCRNIFVQHHCIRSLVAAKIVVPVKINTNDITADAFTKSTIPITNFLYNRARMFNLPIPDPIADPTGPA